MEQIEKVVENHSFFEGMNPDHLGMMVSCASQVHFEAGQHFLRERDAADQFYIMVSGEVQLEIFMLEPGPIQVQTLGPGDVLGWSWLVPPYRWRFDAKAITASDLIAFDAECLRETLEKHPDLGYDLLMRFVMVMEQRLQATRLQLLDAYAIRR
jgi:CRP/FNR family transcriptional regulator, cyclic AMP receptor protein